MKLLKKYWLPAICLAVYLVILVLDQQQGAEALQFSGTTFLNFLFMLTPIFICIGLMDIWIERKTMVRIMGENSGFRGTVLALLMGVVAAVPLYALLPLAGMLLKKGSRIFNVLIFLCASAGIRIPLLLFEISSLGWKFTFVRFGLNLVVIFIIALLIDKFLSAEDKKAVYENAEKF